MTDVKKGADIVTPLKDAEGAICYFCRESDGVLLAMTCCSAHAHYLCLLNWDNVANRDLRCGGCRTIIYQKPAQTPAVVRRRGPQPAMPPRPPVRPAVLTSPDESSVSSTASSPSDVYVECYICSELVVRDYLCDLCSKPLCRTCVIKKYEGQGAERKRADYCAVCLRYFKVLRQDKIARNVSSFAVCAICKSRPCPTCVIENEDDKFCSACVVKVARVYDEEEDVVLTHLRKKEEGINEDEA